MSLFDFAKKLFQRTNIPSKPAPAAKDLIGPITHYYGKIGVAIVKIKNGSLQTGDSIRVYGKHVDYDQKVVQMQIEHKDVPVAQKGEVVGLKVNKKVHAGDAIYRIDESR